MVELVNKRERYTVTDTGPIADDWEDAYLQEVSSFVSNGFVGSSIKHYTEEPDGIPYVQGYNLKNGEIDPSKMYKITRAFNDAQKKTQLKTGDILTVQSGHIGETAVVPKELEGANCHALIISRFKQEQVCPFFMAQYLNSHIGRSRMRGLEVGSTILHINTKDFKKFRLPLPPLSEQKKIVEILKTWDEAIRLAESLIAKRQLEKRTIQKQLIHSADAPLVVIDEICNNLDNKRVPLSSQQRQNMQGEIPYYGANGLLDHINDYIFDEPLILLAEDGGHFGEFQSRPIAYKVTGKSWVNNHAHVLTTKDDVDFNYVFYALEHANIIKYLNGGTRAKLNKSELLKIKLPLPSPEKQEKIGSLLVLLDKEIHLLQAKLSTLRGQKRGLMQQLLTGKVRVNVEDTTPTIQPQQEQHYG